MSKLDYLRELKRKMCMDGGFSVMLGTFMDAALISLLPNWPMFNRATCNRYIWQRGNTPPGGKSLEHQGWRPLGIRFTAKSNLFRQI